MIKFKRGIFKIAINPRAYGAEKDTGERKGWIAGPLAIHGDKYRYTVTHLASGYKTGESRGLKQTKNLVVALLALPIDWNISNPLTCVPQETRDCVRQLNREFLKGRLK